MSKPLVFVNTTVTDPQGNQYDTWELLAFGPCPVMHAIWSPVQQALVCQFDSVKDGMVPKYSQSKSGKVIMNEKKEQLYYRLNIKDEGAIQAILENFVVNYEGGDWKVPPPELPKSARATVEVVSEESNA